MPPSEQELVLLLQEITSLTQHQGLKIGGMVAGPFTKKTQTDYLLWLKEEVEKGAPAKRQVFKLSCRQSKWKIVGKGILPAGLTLSEKNFVDVTGDGILELLYNFSYIKEQCVDGCAISSFQKDSLDILYYKKEQNNCQNIDWNLYAPNSDLPFIYYQLNFIADPLEPRVVVKRFLKKYHGGTSQESVIKQASVDSSALLLVYHRASRQFIQPLDIACNALDFENGKIDIRHPAVRLADQHINKNPKQSFDIEGVYRAHFSNKDQVDYLFYTNTFQNSPTRPLKRKAIKISCDGTKWKVVGILYVAADFSADHIQDVNGDGMDEIIDEQVQFQENACTKTYRILSFKKRVGQLVYSHKNHYTSCDEAHILADQTDGETLGLDYSIHFEDIDNDGIKELIQSSNEGQRIFVYDKLQERYLLQP
ncbi:MAG: Unknown protein [uncultured Aureispira sp.]|uniref:Uncharacterized protein n=1 Tax=uncultured Aureispira sp. TaxID=1331704 RepID=A0A6S6SXY7_9BACT|nr:MAG: Unknown protein [uncultured Aureispira sp.]